jgi:hypothetical protein
MQLMTAAACGMVGRYEEARTAIESLRKYNPTFLDLENVRQDIAKMRWKSSCRDCRSRPEVWLGGFCRDGDPGAPSGGAERRLIMDKLICVAISSVDSCMVYLATAPLPEALGSM